MDLSKWLTPMIPDTGDEYGISERYVSTPLLSNVSIEIFKFRVMFGYRLRAGYTGYMSSELDICCGAQPKAYEEIFTKVVAIMISNGPENVFKNIPIMSKIKPYYNDNQFLDTIEELYSKVKIEL